MPIHDQSYRHWEGNFKSHLFRWWVITREGLKIILRHKMFLMFILAPPAIQFFVYGAIIYGVKVYGKLFNMDIINAKFFFDFFVRQTFFIALICVFGGSGLIANDLKYNALQLYLSKPLTRIDYLLGKLAIVLILMGAITLAPGIILFLENSVLSSDSNFIREQYWLLGSIVIYSLILILPTGLLILALSSLTKSNRYAAIGFITILIGTPIISQMLGGMFKTKKTDLASYWMNLYALGRRIFRLPNPPDYWHWSLLIIIGLVALCIWTMYRKVKGVEIVK